MNEYADVIGPDDQRQNAFPKSKLEKTDGEQPAREPGKRGKRMIFNFDFVHTFILSSKN